MSALFSLLAVAARRLWANRRLALGLLAGFTVAVSAAASIPVYAAGALQRVLQAELAGGAAVHFAHVENPRRPTRAQHYLAAHDLMLAEGAQAHYAALDSTRADGDRWLSLGYLTDLQQKARVTDGRWPHAANPYEAVVTRDFLEQQDLTVGAQLSVPISRAEGAPKLSVAIVGEVEALDPGDPYWFLGTAFEKTLFLPEASFQEILSHEKASPGEYHWFFGPQDVKITAVARFLRRLYTLEVRLAQVLPDTEIFAGPHELLSRYAQRAADLEYMLLVLAVPTLAIAAYFVLVTSGMLVERQRQEIAVLRSRGAGLGQILFIYLLEGGLLAGTALAAGYPLGALLARLMGAAAGFLQFVDRKLPPLLLPRPFWWYGLGAALLAVLAYTLPALAASRQTITPFKQESARTLRRPFWWSWGLDLLFIALAGYAYYILRARGAGGAGLIEPLHIIAPALLVFGGGLFLLRVLPLLFALAARLADRRAGAPLYLTLAQLSRNPSHYTPVVLLLTLTVGMGLYGAAVARTLERNTSDRLFYAAGADVVLDEAWEFEEREDGTAGEAYPPPWHAHDGLPGVVQAARVRTEDVTPLIGGRSRGKGVLMAIDPPDFGRVAWFRRDLTRAHPYAYLNLLAKDEEAAIVSRGFMQRNNLRLGDRISLGTAEGTEVSLVVYAAVDYWPTLDPAEKDFFIANLDFVEQAVGIGPYAVWLRMEDGARLGPAVDALKERSVRVVAARDVRQSLIRALRDPALNGVLGGLSSGFLLAAAVTVLGFWLHAALSAGARALQFGVLRALGLSVGQLIAAVALEQVLSAAAGVAAGTALGLAAAHLFVPFLQQGGQVPPFQVVAGEADRRRLYAVLVVMLLIGLAGLVVALRRLRIHEAVRLGEDH